MNPLMAGFYFAGVVLLATGFCAEIAAAQHFTGDGATDRRSVYFEKFIDRGGEDTDVATMLKSQGHITLQNRIEELADDTGIKIEVPINPDYASLIRARRIKAKELESLFEGIPEEEKIRLESADYIVVPEFTAKGEKNHVNVLIFKPRPRGIQFFHQAIIWNSLYEFHFDKLACGVMQKILREEDTAFSCERQIGFQKFVVRTTSQTLEPEMLGKLRMFLLLLKSALINEMSHTHYQVTQTDQEGLVAEPEDSAAIFSDPDANLEFAVEHGLDIILSGMVLIGDSVNFLCTISQVDYRLNSVKDIGSVMNLLNPDEPMKYSEELASKITERLSQK